MLDHNTLRILVLDDEPFMLKLLAQMLTHQGFTMVTTCDNGRTALELFDSPNKPPDLILLDLNMPKMDGVEFIRRLVKRGYAGSLILVSGEDKRILQTAEKLMLAHKVTVLGHLNKPVKPEDLLAMIQTWTSPLQKREQTKKKTYGAEEVKSAITNSEFVNYYQPKVVVTTGELVGVETLVRWRHPVDGMVFPDQFISVAEAHNLINDLTSVVMAGALAQARIWKEAGLSLRVAINVSMDNLTALDFADVVASQAAAAGVLPQDLILEVTESRLMEDMKAPLDTLTRLRLKRFHLSIDDFGTGHSSLTQLSDIPFDELKVDRSFVHGAGTNETVRAMYEASLRLAKQLGMKVVAEGVEDRNDWEFIRQTGCDFAQGYFIAKPMPADGLPTWMEDWQEKAKKL
jgi:EAL domain-containing protein (putative c-di-GMP-specific phosphodiesterase class I)/CheY-like chemotaxis protein